MAVALLTESVDRNYGDSVNQADDAASLSSRRAWIEILIPARTDTAYLSLSSRRAWIEICTALWHALWWTVALLTESVDRNPPAPFPSMVVIYVALLTESVDRNTRMSRRPGLAQEVALLTESVDRNHYLHPRQPVYSKSLSSRRAWIEIPLLPPPCSDQQVALLTESVDRNKSWKRQTFLH